MLCLFLVNIPKRQFPSVPFIKFIMHCILYHDSGFTTLKYWLNSKSANKIIVTFNIKLLDARLQLTSAPKALQNSRRLTEIQRSIQYQHGMFVPAAQQAFPGIPNDRFAHVLKVETLRNQNSTLRTLQS